MLNLLVLANIFGIMVFLAVLTLLVKPFGTYMAKIYEDKPVFLTRIVKPIENIIYKIIGTNSSQEMTWKQYAVSLVFFNILGLVVLFLLLFFQSAFINPQHFSGFSWDLAVNTAVSFVTNTNWQNYAGESSASYFTQMAGFAVQNFLSAATGLCILVVLIRGLVRRTSQTIGNFWADMVKSVVYILLPLSIILAIVLVSQGAIQNFSPYVHSILLQSPVVGTSISSQTIPMGPVASQEAIKDLGTNGGGFFNANSAHPFENPTPLTNLLEILALLLIPAASTYMFGKMVGDTRQGWTIYGTMMLIFLISVGTMYWAEMSGTSASQKMGIQGHYMEGKEVRFGTAGSVLFSTATTVTSTGSVNNMHDSLTPLGGMIAMVDIALGEVVFGGVGSGLYTMLAFIIIAVFVAGLMIGRMPDYLGNKIEPAEMWLSIIIVLASTTIALVCITVTLILPAGIQSIFHSGAHGLSEVLYAFLSMSNNNGSAFAGLNGNTLYYNLLGALAMFLGRFIPAVAAIAMAGTLARKKFKKPTEGTLQTYGLIFIIWLAFIILIVGALSFFPAFAAGPIVEHILMLRGV
jgi:potassium-transporting ATPase potassium-binding subunit